MPVLFVGHGSPMNAIEDNEFSRTWKKLGKVIGEPKAILMVSAHWYTKETRVNDSEVPEMIYDMYGFPRELYEVKYPVAGSPLYAAKTISSVSKQVSVDNSWGCDHGAWSVLVHMYPDADVPVFQLSIDRTAPSEVHYQIGQELSSLRDSGVLIIGSGNIVHNLGMVDWSVDGGFPWALEFDKYVKDKIVAKKYMDVVNYHLAGASASFAVPTLDHFLPLLYVLGAVGEADEVSVFNEKCVLGSVSMTGYLFN